MTCIERPNTRSTRNPEKSPPEFHDAYTTEQMQRPVKRRGCPHRTARGVTMSVATYEGIQTLTVAQMITDCIPVLSVPPQDHYDRKTGKKTRTGGVDGAKVAATFLRILWHVDSPESAFKGEKRPDKSKKRAWESHNGLSLSVMLTGVSMENRKRLIKAGKPAPLGIHSDKTGRRSAHWLSQLGLVQITTVKGHANRYKVLPDGVCKLAESVREFGRDAAKKLGDRAGDLFDTVAVAASEVIAGTATTTTRPPPETPAGMVAALMGERRTGLYGTRRSLRRQFEEFYNADTEKWREDWLNVRDATQPETGQSDCTRLVATEKRGRIKWSELTELPMRMEAARAHVEGRCRCEPPD